MAVTTDLEKSTLTLTDMGATVRTLLAFAAKGYEQNQKRKWRILYKGAVIGSLQVRTRNKAPVGAEESKLLQLNNGLAVS